MVTKLVLELIKKIQFLRKVKVIHSFLANRKVKGNGKVILYNGSNVKTHETSNIYLDNILSLNGSRFFNEKTQGGLFMSKKSELVIEGRFDIMKGFDIYLGENATLRIGSGYAMDNLRVQCIDNITIGSNVIISRNVTIRDSDSHKILDGVHEPTKEIIIGDHVWIGLNVTILKGVKVGNGAIIAAGSLVNNDVPERALVGGIPAKVIKYDVDWEE
ncbi:acyltransferase [Pseudoalteromonas sp. S1608]|uniref:acyltransferase n=1 Tax=Pseudoalteromonas sp. S1608 TaxID=579504 RepID=UPI00110ACE21|nr:acyltransferase [Pseudoalteromonas sp. S1608]TMP71819.1 acyltransferase [Pseudoalteromonas sp. S1608]